MTACSGCVLFNRPPRDVRENVAIIEDQANWKNAEKVRSAARKLKVLEHPAAVDPLIELLRHEDPWVRGDARGALIQITGMNFSDNYDEWRRWWDTNREVFMENWEARQEVPEEEKDRLRAELKKIPRPELGWIARHVRHAIHVGGEDVIGLGGDLDGISATPLGIDTVADYALLPELLERAGLAPRQVEKVCYRNFLRIFSEVLPER